MLETTLSIDMRSHEISRIFNISCFPLDFFSGETQHLYVYSMVFPISQTLHLRAEGADAAFLCGLVRQTTISLSSGEKKVSGTA